MRACGRHLKSRAFRGSDELAARAVHFDAQLADVFADARAGLDDGLVQLVLHLLRDVRGSCGDKLADVRTQFARRRVNNLEFFFNADGEAVSHGVALWFAWSYWGLRASYHTAAWRKLHARGLHAATHLILNKKGQTRMSVPSETCWAGPFLT